MRKLHIISVLIALAPAVSADTKKPPPAKGAAMPVAKAASITALQSDLKWTDVPGRPGAQEAIVEGDGKTGASHFYVKYPKGFQSGPHHHSSAHGGYVLSGTLILEVDGKETKLPAGSFYWVEANKPHASKCDPTAECVQALDVRGKWDVVPEPAAKPTTKK